MEKTQSKKKLWVVAVLALIIVLLLLGYYLWRNGSSFQLSGLFKTASVYQAIFLSNGQVYFGKASNINSQYLTLKDVYYLQVSQVLQPVQGKQQPQAQQAVSLAKLGVSELHKPLDEMKINRDHVIFIEDLAPDSQVVQAIERYRASRK